MPNVFADDGRDFYFISDPPHLLKTIRNSFCNAKRRLWVWLNTVCVLSQMVAYINKVFVYVSFKDEFCLAPLEIASDQIMLLH